MSERKLIAKCIAYFLCAGLVAYIGTTAHWHFIEKPRVEKWKARWSTDQ